MIFLKNLERNHGIFDMKIAILSILSTNSIC
jgi:hypothetical protein